MKTRSQQNDADEDRFFIQIKMQNDARQEHQNAVA